MVKIHKVAKSISDAAWGQFSRFIAYKGDWQSYGVEKIDRWAPSTKLCSVRGFKNNDLTLNDRDWVCPKCGVKHDRDFNAAINIWSIGRAGTALDNASGMGVSLAKRRLSTLNRKPLSKDRGSSRKKRFGSS